MIPKARQNQQHRFRTLPRLRPLTRTPFGNIFPLVSADELSPFSHRSKDSAFDAPLRSYAERFDFYSPITEFDRIIRHNSS
jgi:hypothetical protein